MDALMVLLSIIGICLKLYPNSRALKHAKKCLEDGATINAGDLPSLSYIAHQMFYQGVKDVAGYFDNDPGKVKSGVREMLEEYNKLLAAVIPPNDVTISIADWDKLLNAARSYNTSNAKKRGLAAKDMATTILNINGGDWSEQTENNTTPTQE